MRNFAQLRTKSHFFVPFNSEEKIFIQKADHSTIFTLIDKCKENHGESERVYASRRGS